MKKNVRKLASLVGFILLIAMSLFSGNDRAMAADVIISNGGTLGGGCYDWWDTCFGSTWRWYPYNYTTSPGSNWWDSVSYNYSTDTATVYGPTNEVNGGSISGCARYGGYFRQGLETHHKEWNGAITLYYHHVGAVSQQGAGYVTNRIVTDNAGGRKTYSWDTVKSIFESLGGEKSTYDGNKKYYVNSSGGVARFSTISMFCAYDPEKHTLSAYAIDQSGNLLNNGNRIDSASGSNGQKVVVSRKKFTTPAGYTWTYHWKYYDNKATDWDSRSETADHSEIDFYSHTMNVDKKAFAVYQRNSFQGRADVAKGTSYADAAATDKTSTGWQSDSKDMGTFSIKGCPDEGCSARFVLRLKTTAGDGSTVYTIRKNGSPLSDYNGKTINPKTNSTGSPNCSNGECWVAFTEHLDPGQTTCYSITFRPYGGKSNDATSIETVCAKAEPTKFEGKTSVSGSITGTTDWNNGEKYSRVAIPNCSPVSGCKITFDHRMRRQNNEGVGTSKYYITRTSNLTDSSSDRRIEERDKVSPLGKGPFSGAEAEVYRSEELTLYPGMVVCESLYFLPNNEPATISGEKYVPSELCVSAEGDGQPPDPESDIPEDPDKPSGDASYLNIKVRNANVSKYDKYQRLVYAKPEDGLDYRAVYNPNLQYTYYLRPQGLQINGGTVSSNNNLAQMWEFFNSNNGNLADWNNAFGVKRDNFEGSVFKNLPPLLGGSYALGSVVRRTEKDPNGDNNHYIVDRKDVGRELTETAKLNNFVDENKTTPTQITFKDSNGINVGNVITNGDVGNIAKALVPYNYTTSINVDIPDRFSSGEEGTTDIYIKVNPKGNQYTTNSSDEKYATKVNQARIKLVLYVPGAGTTKNGDSNFGNLDSDLCSRYGGSSICQSKDVPGPGSTFTFNSDGNLDGFEEGKKVGKFYVPDLDAGTEVCVAAANYPSTSGADTNINASGDGKWNVSDSKCFKIYKKPSLQVWGGSVYSAGKLNVPYAAKKHVYGINDYGINSTNSYYVFGSWTELSLVSLKENTGFGSGASMGYVSNSGGALSPSYNSFNSDGLNPGGSLETSLNFCVRSVLTFANTTSGTSLMCKDKTPGLGASGSGTAENNKSSLIARFINISEEEKKKIKYYSVNELSGLVAREEDQDAFDNSGEELIIKKGKTVVIDAVNGLSRHYVTIDKNIRYEDGYATLSDIPKLIIYADNILIKCAVSRVDAVLIANNNVNTCSDNNLNEDSRERSNQLLVNGTIITHEMNANRTYGAAKGSNSIIPAEIINYDTTLYLWGSNEADVSESGKLTDTYSHELSPRF